MARETTEARIFHAMALEKRLRTVPGSPSRACARRRISTRTLGKTSRFPDGIVVRSIQRTQRTRARASAIERV